MKKVILIAAGVAAVVAAGTVAYILDLGSCQKKVRELCANGRDSLDGGCGCTSCGE